MHIQARRYSRWSGYQPAGQDSGTVRCRAGNRIAMFTWRGHGVRRTANQARLAAPAGTHTVAQWMQGHTEHRAGRKPVDRDAVSRSLRSAFHLDGPDQRLALRVTQHRVARVVQRREKDLQVIGVRVHARHDAREDIRLLDVVHGERMVRGCAGTDARRTAPQALPPAVDESRSCETPRTSQAETALFLRALHALLMVLLPGLRPRASIEIRHGIFERRSRRQRSCEALHRKVLLYAIQERMRLALIELAGLLPGLRDPDRFDQGIGVVQHGLMVDSGHGARCVAPGRVGLDRLQLVAELMRTVRKPPLDIRGPRDERVPIPEPDRLAVPARDVRPESRDGARFIELARKMDVRDEVRRRRVEDLHELRRDDHLRRARRVLRETAHEAFGLTIGTRPLRRIRRGIVIHLLHQTLLVFGREQREIRRNLHEAAVIPGRGLGAVTKVFTVPVRQPIAGVYRRPAFGFAFRQQRGVMLLRSMERVWADDLRARIVALAITPGGGGGRVIADRRRLRRAPLRFEALRRVASEIPRVRPQRAVTVEIPRREDVDGQRGHACRNGAIARGDHLDQSIRMAGMDEHPFAVGANDRGGTVLRRPAATLARRQPLQDHVVGSALHLAIFAIAVDVQRLVRHGTRGRVAEGLAAIREHFLVPVRFVNHEERDTVGVELDVFDSIRSA